MSGSLRRRWRVRALSLALGVAWASGQAQVPAREPATVALRLEPVTYDVDVPVFATGAGDGSGRLFVVQLDGLVRILVAGTVLERPFLDLRDRVTALEGEQGLFSLAFHPDYARNGRFFVSFTERERGDLVVEEHRVSADDPNVAHSDAPSVRLLSIPFHEPFHYAGQVAFGPEGYLYISVGDGIRNPERRRGDEPSQDLGSLHGKLLRLDVDGASPYVVPGDNPFVGAEGVRGEIFAYGFRNPWKFSFDPETGAIFVADVGEDRWEEINLVTAGGNYGWPYREGEECYRFPDTWELVLADCRARTDLLDPAASYGHVNIDARGGNSVTGGYLYRGDSSPDLRGRYLFGDFASGRLWSLERTASGWRTEELLETPHRISSFAVDDRGELYLLDIVGSVHRILAP